MLDMPNIGSKCPFGVSIRYDVCLCRKLNENSAFTAVPPASRAFPEQTKKS